MVVTAVAFTLTTDVDIADTVDADPDAGVSAHIDHTYLAARHVRAYRLPPLRVGFRGRDVVVGRRLLHFRRIGVMDVVVELDDEEAAGYLAQFEGSASAASAELFTVDGDRTSVRGMLEATLADVLERGVARHGTSSHLFGRVVFHRQAGPPGGESHGGLVRAHRVSSTVGRIDVWSDTTVLADARLGYVLIAGLCGRTAHLIDRSISRADRVLVAAREDRQPADELVRRATDVQQELLLVQREVSAYGVLSGSLAGVHQAVRAGCGVPDERREQLSQAVRALEQLVQGLAARSFDRTVRRISRAAVLAGAGLVVLGTLLILANGDAAALWFTGAWLTTVAGAVALWVLWDRSAARR